MTQRTGREGSQQNAPNREELLQMGIRAARAGNQDAARIAFQQVLGQDKRNERAMMWMAKLAEKPAERRKWLERVLDVNPDNDAAREAIQRMAYKTSARENRVLLMFGMVVGVLIVLALVVILLAALSPKG
jgi:Tfp pilus assembly protein PilF